MTGDYETDSKDNRSISSLAIINFRTQEGKIISLSTKILTTIPLIRVLGRGSEGKHEQ